MDGDGSGNNAPPSRKQMRAQKKDEAAKAKKQQLAEKGKRHKATVRRQARGGGPAGPPPKVLASASSSSSPDPSRAKKKRPQQQDAQEVSDEALSTTGALKGIGMLIGGIAAAILGVPFVIALVGRFAVGREMFVWSTWGVMVPAIAYIFLVRHKATMTWNSLAESLMLWALVTFGAYTMIDIPKFTQGAFSFLNTHLGEASNMEGLSTQEQFQAVHNMVLLLWCTILFAANVAWMWFDDTDHKTEEEKEARREDRQRKKEDEKAARRKDRKVKKKEELAKAGKAMDPKKKRMLDMVIYFGFAMFCVWAVYKGYFAFVEFQEHLELLHMDNKIG